jgi:uracil-DNA glycosylase family 4
MANRIIVQRLESFQRAGVTHLPKVKRSAKSAQASPLTNPQPKEDGARSVPAMVGDGPASSAKAADSKREPGESLFDSRLDQRPVIPSQERLGTLEVIRNEVVACTRCKELAAGRTQTVFGVGNPNARICFFGEAPGADEDRLGEPFVGRAGQLLDKMIVACKMKREDVYILNVLKCRPPGNRNPLPDEVTNCRGFFERQLDTIRPEIICCLGAVAAQSLLVTDRSIGKLRGRLHDYRGIPVICTYHPAYLLRNPAAKHDAWEDLKLMMRKLGTEL